MSEEATTGAALGVCTACQGLWVDWFDGDVRAIAIEVEAARERRGTPLPSRPSAPPHAGCPRCETALGVELYRFPEATEGELVPDVEVLRCAECAGAFVPRGSALLLLDRARQGRTLTAWQALRELVARWLGAQ